MTEVLFVLITIFVTYVVYKSASEKDQQAIPTSKAEPEQTSVPVAIQAKPEKPVAAVKPSTPRSASKTAKAAVVKPVVEAKSQIVQELVDSTSQAEPERPIVPVAIQAKPEKPAVAVKPSIPRSASKTAKAVVVKPVVETQSQALQEIVGLTAGSIWNYLDKNGPTTVAKLVRELPEDEKAVQRSIGWLAQEGKITLDTIDRAETISLKE
ncbi:MAG: winged helix-turn-helix domain-containing protein [Methyloglobulus sp.]|nr:winged helix-turn-helix domain-containing protein [Methyloglobulus sp.]